MVVCYRPCEGINAIWSISTEGDLLDVYLGAEMDVTPYDGLSNVRVVSGGEFGMPHGATLDSDVLVGFVQWIWWRCSELCSGL